MIEARGEGCAFQQQNGLSVGREEVNRDYPDGQTPKVCYNSGHRVTTWILGTWGFVILFYYSINIKFHNKLFLCKNTLDEMSEYLMVNGRERSQ